MYDVYKYLRSGRKAPLSFSNLKKATKRKHINNLIYTVTKTKRFPLILKHKSLRVFLEMVLVVHAIVVCYALKYRYKKKFVPPFSH